MDCIQDLLRAGYDPYELYGLLGCVEEYNDFICHDSVEEEKEEEEGDE